MMMSRDYVVFCLKEMDRQGVDEIAELIHLKSNELGGSVNVQIKSEGANHWQVFAYCKDKNILLNLEHLKELASTD